MTGGVIGIGCPVWVVSYEHTQTYSRGNVGLYSSKAAYPTVDSLHKVVWHSQTILSPEMGALGWGGGDSSRFSGQHISHVHFAPSLPNPGFSQHMSQGAT